MAGKLTVIPIRPTKGLDLSRTPNQSDVNSFYLLKGFKFDELEPGKIKQSPMFKVADTITQGTYYNAGSQTEPSSSSVVLITKGVRITDYCAYIAGTSTQCKIYHQTAVPTGATATKHCMVIINDTATLGVTLGNTLDIVIDGATTFKYRINGGAYTALVPITTSGVSILAGAATVYFLTAAGFTVADTWTWTRNDWVSNLAISSTGVPLQSTRWRNKTFFINSAGRVMQIAQDNNNVYYIISTGYRLVYGRSVNTFQDHLIVTNYTDTSNVTTASTSLVVANSDLNDLDCFLSTDVNEADTYTIPAELRGVDVSTQLIGSFVYNAQLFILTNSIVYVTNYLGLPLVFSFVKYCNIDLGWRLVGDIPYCGILTTAEGSDRGVYVLGNKKLYFFNGAGFSDITSPILPNATGSNYDPAFLSVHYIPFQHEVWIRPNSATTIYCFQELTGTWYERYVSFTNLGFAVCFGISYSGNTGLTLIGIPGLKIMVECLPSDTPVFDATSGTTFGTPTLTTQILSAGQFSKQKETDSVYLLVNGSSGASTVLTLKHRLSTAGEVGTATGNALAVWNSTSPTKLLTFPRTSFAGIQFQLEITNTNANNPPRTIDFYGLDVIVNGWNLDETDR